VEASILSLYDKERFSGTVFDGSRSEWSLIDEDIKDQLKAIAMKGGEIRILSNTLLSPTTRSVIDRFISQYPRSKHIEYDSISYEGIKEANRNNFGKPVIPSYDFSKAEVIVSFNADFLGTWLDPIRFSHDYAQLRKLSKEDRNMSRHYQFEALMSLTGAKADYRIPLRPSAEGLVIAKLYNLIAAKTGSPAVRTQDPDEIKFLEKAANHLLENKGRSLVVSGSNDPSIQMLINGINHMLQNYGNTLDLERHVNFRNGSDQEMDRFIEEAASGQINAVILFNANPVYNHPRGDEIAGALENMELVISTSDRMDETTAYAKYIAPDHHYLESWNDAEPVPGHVSLVQPVITPLFETRQAQDSLLIWSGGEEIQDYYHYLKDTWEKKYFTKQDQYSDFQRFWDQSLHDGIFTYTADIRMPEEFSIETEKIASYLNRKYSAGHSGLELILYQKVAIGDGTQANNPWLQEMPDPITKAVWDNYITLSPRDAGELGITSEGNEYMLANLIAEGKTVTLPVLVQPGQVQGTLGLAVGYGRKKAGRVANDVGFNAIPFAANGDGFWSYVNLNNISLEPTEGRYKLAQTQTHHTYMSRSNVLQEAYLSEYQSDPYAGRHLPKIKVSEYLDEQLGDDQIDGEVEPYAISLWKGHDYNNHHWGMIIDLNSCIGCGACTIACQVENNVPVVGKEEVLNRREMHWIRIDRYYSSNAPAYDWMGLEKAAENPEVTFQPMLCQHCNNAPCETVCPVVATTHSTEGLNQMAYNRCIGTRYCANNCPYKVRRFNWFKYHDNRQFEKNLGMNNDLGKMVLNPDVVVRSRGVMEKCTFCVHRIQYGKLEAKKEGRRPRDGEINSACAEACPSDAIVFGDMNDPESKISGMLRLREKNDTKIVQEERAFHVLEEVGTRPNVFYYTKIRNKDIEDNNA
jgi:molybdopterin-containing oxidoreductase family iron-sulfur binding subunit